MKAKARRPARDAAKPPLELVASTPKGQLKNPYNADIAAITEEGHHRFLSIGCNGCHGGGGGGGICPSLTNDVWVYGAGDDTLFRLITLGSVELQKQGFSPVKHETVPGPMPPFGGNIKTSDDLWRIIAFIRSVNPGSNVAGDAVRFVLAERLGHAAGARALTGIDIGDPLAVGVADLEAPRYHLDQKQTLQRK